MGIMDRMRAWREERREPAVAVKANSKFTSVAPAPAKSAREEASPPIANGWTAKEAAAMDAHISDKAAREWARTEPSDADYRRAERASDATDPMHDARREKRADAWSSVQSVGRTARQPENAREVVASDRTAKEADTAASNEGRSWIASAASAVKHYKDFRDPKDTGPLATQRRNDAEDAITTAWNHPEAEGHARCRHQRGWDAQ